MFNSTSDPDETRSPAPVDPNRLFDHQALLQKQLVLDQKGP